MMRLEHLPRVDLARLMLWASGSRCCTCGRSSLAGVASAPRVTMPQVGRGWGGEGSGVRRWSGEADAHRLSPWWG